MIDSKCFETSLNISEMLWLVRGSKPKTKLGSGSNNQARSSNAATNTSGVNFIFGVSTFVSECFLTFFETFGNAGQMSNFWQNVSSDQSDLKSI